jgi:hypothetical protein
MLEWRGRWLLDGERLVEECSPWSAGQTAPFTVTETNKVIPPCPGLHRWCCSAAPAEATLSAASWSPVRRCTSVEKQTDHAWCKAAGKHVRQGTVSSCAVAVSEPASDTAHVKGQQSPRGDTSTVAQRICSGLFVARGYVDVVPGLLQNHIADAYNWCAC